MSIINRILRLFTSPLSRRLCEWTMSPWWAWFRAQGVGFGWTFVTSVCVNEPWVDNGQIHGTKQRGPYQFRQLRPPRIRSRPVFFNFGSWANPVEKHYLLNKLSLCFSLTTSEAEPTPDVQAPREKRNKREKKKTLIRKTHQLPKLRQSPDTQPSWRAEEEKRGGGGINQ